MESKIHKFNTPRKGEELNNLEELAWCRSHVSLETIGGEMTNWRKIQIVNECLTTSR